MASTDPSNVSSPAPSSPPWQSPEPERASAPVDSAPAKHAKVERARTGIAGFDEMIEGGIPRHSIVLLSGACGTGKSTFGMEFLYNGALDGETGVYLSLEEEPESLVRNLDVYDWKLDEQIAAGRIIVTKPELYEFDALLDLITRTVEETGAKRLVIDSFTLISAYLDSTYEVRKALFRLGHHLKKLGCTTLAISDIRENSHRFSTTGYEEFIADGVIVLSLLIKPPSNNFVRAVFVRKMRATNHSLKFAPFSFQPTGITAYPEAEIFDI